MRGRTGLLALLVLLACAACTDDADAPAAADPPPTPTTPATTPAWRATAAAEPVRTLAAPTTPATTAGAITPADLPAPPGWTPVPGSGDDGRYLPNGTWVHDVPAAEAATDLMSHRCTALPGTFPAPVAVLAATYTGAAGEPGVAQAVDFRTADDAAAFLALYAEGVRSCSTATAPAGPASAAFTAADVTTTDDRLVDRREFADGSGTWVEVVARAGGRLTFTLLSDPGGVYAGDRLDALATTVTGGTTP